MWTLKIVCVENSQTVAIYIDMVIFYDYIKLISQNDEIKAFTTISNHVHKN